MKRLIIIAGLMLVVPGLLFAQINWTEHIIDNNFGYALSVFAIDMDGDLDIDVLGAAYVADDITWWENDGGNPPSFTKHIIAGNFDGARSVFAINMDGDLDIDVLGAAYIAGDIAWWKNIGGSPPSFTKYTIADNFNGAEEVYAIDMDGDLDIDVLGAAYVADDITWWENDGGNPPSFTEHIIADNFTGAASVFAIDVNGDSAVDVLGAAYYINEITWWENDGGNPPSFTKHTIADNFDGAYSVYAIDMDGDLDIDVLGAACVADDITWWENDGGNPPSFTEHTIANNFDSAISVFAIDLDGDLDIDVLGAASSADDITWWENIGGSPPSFTKHTIADNFDGAVSVFAIDVNDNSAVDVLGAAHNANDITWWENGQHYHDVGLVLIDLPDTVAVGTILNPSATVTNLGTATEIFDVTCEIEPDAYSSTETVTDLAPGDSIQVTFSPDFTFGSGPYTVTVYTRLIGDENPANDTLEKVIETVLIDVGTFSIDIPDTVPVATTFSPKATVKNFGTATISSFTTRCEIDYNDYMSTKTVHDLAPGAETQVTFNPITFDEPGVYTATVYTRLADIDPSNDTLSKPIVVVPLGIEEGNSHIPIVFSFGLKNNPAKSKAVFNLALPEEAKVTLMIYDVTGRLIDKMVSNRQAGYYEISWSKDVSSGIFFYHLDSPWQQKIGKLVLLK